MTEAVFKHTVKQKGLESKFIVDSCGTNTWRELPNSKSVEMNLLDAERLKPEASKSIVKLFGEYDPQDPYLGDIKDYESSFGQVTRYFEGFSKT
nr:2205_t:CDS:2 [Entrophospora candida]